jgi:hypothetical protein
MEQPKMEQPKMEQKTMYEKHIKEQPVPEDLRSFLDLPEGACMRRPEVKRMFENKLRELGPDKAPEINKNVSSVINSVEFISLINNNKNVSSVINSVEFISFFASFYSKK